MTRLERELQELERTDPAVAAAKARLDATIQQIITPADVRIAHLTEQRQRYWRHMWHAVSLLRELDPKKADELVEMWDRETLDPSANLDLGARINRCANLGMAVTRLRAELPEIEKQARKTPRRDMSDERAKVVAAKARIEPLRAELAKAEAEYATVHAELERLGFYPRTAESNTAHQIERTTDK